MDEFKELPPLTPREAVLELERILARSLARKHHEEELKRAAAETKGRPGKE